MRIVWIPHLLEYPSLTVSAISEMMSLGRNRNGSVEIYAVVHLIHSDLTQLAGGFAPIGALYDVLESMPAYCIFDLVNVRASVVMMVVRYHA